MSVRATLVATIALAVSASVSAASSASWPELPAPPRTTVQWVAENMEFNGMPMQIRTFRSELSAADVLAYYRARWWDGKRCGCVENRVGLYQQIARGEGRYFYTVQVRAVDGRTSQGYMAVTVPASPKVVAGAGFPQPPATRVMNDIRADDNETRSRTLLMENSLALPANAAFFERELPGLGWQAAGRMPAEGIARSLLFRRAGEELTLLFKERGRRTIIGATVVEHRFAGDRHARTGVR
ncbi:MAG TPA: hypothetical protein VNT02_04075 [Burkholderiales bacterium]|nr:hypothetical protein [Burkholderiales bacterium]